MDLSKEKVLVGMSGGVDSSVAAALLLEQGYEVIGITITSIKIDDDCKADTRESGCCNYQAILDAKDVCNKLGIEHHLVDLSKVFKQKIISNFVEEYMNGRTPNPCTLCNPLIKWGEVLKHADKYGCYYYATGHYSQIAYDDELNRYWIKKGIDNNKDQSYFLWGLSQKQIARTILPLGHLTKPETRELAKKFNIHVFDKTDSQEICFVPSNDYSDFLIKNVKGIDTEFAGGKIMFNGGEIGTHRGYPFYTVGQRKGLGVSYKEPLYVRKIIPESNTVELAVEKEIKTDSLIAEGLSLMKYDNIEEDKIYQAKIRYRDKGVDCVCRIDEQGELNVRFNEPRKAITPGQSVVIYEGDDVVAGAVIKEAFNEG